MSKKFSFSYCLLQYMHNPWLKERMNIGVLLYSAEASFFKLAVRGWDGRITAAYPDLNKAAFTEDLKQISRAVQRFYRDDIAFPNLLSTSGDQVCQPGQKNEARFLASAIAPDHDSSYTWVDGGVGLCASPEERLSALYQRFVASFDREKPRSPRSDDQVWSEVSKLLAARKLTEQIQSEPRVQTDLGQIKFQAGYQNGSFHAIQSLSFDLTDEDGISAKAGKWGGFAQAVKVAGRPHGTVAQFIVGKPTRDILIKPYQSAKAFLKKIVGEENVFEELDSEKFVDRIEVDLRHH